MSAWSRSRALFSRLSGKLTADHPMVARYLSDYAPTGSGVNVNEQTALGISAVWAAVSFLSSQLASLPCLTYLEEGDTRVRDTGSRLYRLLREEPNPEISAFTLFELLTSHLLLWGNAYSEIERDNAGRVIGLWPIHPSLVEPIRQRGNLYYRVNATPYDANPKQVVLTPDDVVHVPGLGYDGTKGYSVIQTARESLGLAAAQEKWSANFYGQGATVGGIVSFAAPLKPEQVKDVEERLAEKHAGLSRAHRLMVLSHGADFKSLGMPARDQQFIEARQFSVIEVCRIFGVPPSKLHSLEHGTYSNVEQQALAFVQDRLRPLCVRFERELTRKLCAGPRFVEFLLDGLLRGTTLERYQSYQIARQIGVMSVNDIRRLENLSPVADGDSHEPLFNGGGTREPKGSSNEN